MFDDRDAADGISIRCWVPETDDADERGWARAMCTCVIPLTYDEAAAALGVRERGSDFILAFVSVHTQDPCFPGTSLVHLVFSGSCKDLPAWEGTRPIPRC